jgi:ubiquinol-cytochrome c reductase iron-sulfur subunit
VKDAPEVPDFSPYRPKDDNTNRAMSYFMVGSLGILSASVAQSTITGFLESMAASADVLALAKTEVQLASIPEGKNVIIKWRGKPVFIRHRTPDEIEEARNVNWKTLRDPQSDDERVKKPEWLVMLGVCTHLGCVPIGESGDYGGWCITFFPVMTGHSDSGYLGSVHVMVLTTIFVCSHEFLSLRRLTDGVYVTAGRARKGPAPVGNFTQYSGHHTNTVLQA